MPEDIRDRAYLNHKDILGLNFIRAPGIYLYRRHYSQGLRSHIMEVLDPEDVENEAKGVMIDGLRWYPRAKPSKMLRIYRTRFKNIEDAEEELKRVRIVQTHLAPDHVARSEEFLVDYKREEDIEILLCGLQEYVRGEVLDPWSHLDKDHLISLLRDMGCDKGQDSVAIIDQWIHSVQETVESFIGRLKKMILEANHVPDLAGVGNLLLTRSGDLKLVDINNISRVSFDSIVKLDDRCYPVCDKSIEALSLLEQKLLDRSSYRDDLIYKTFLDPKRMEEVQAIEEEFHLPMKPAMSYSETS